MAAERNPITSGVKEKDIKLNQDSGHRHPTIAELLIQIESKSYKSIEHRASLLITVWTCLARQVGSFHDIKNVFHMIYRESAMMVFSSQWPKVSCHYKRGLARSLSQFSKAMGNSVNRSEGLCLALVMTIYDPWGDPVILHLLTAEQIDKRMVSDFISAEPFELLLIRIECLVNAHLSKAAIRLCRCCLEKTRIVPSLDTAEMKWRWIFSEWLMWMLFRNGQLNELVAESVNCSCHDGVHLIYHTHRSQREDSEALTETLINLFLVRDLLFHSNYCCTNELMTLWCDFQIRKQSSISEVQEAARKLLVGHASTSAYFYLFVDILWSKFNISLLPLYLEFYIRGLTSDLNFLEIARQAENKESVIEIENHIAAMYFKLSSMFSSVSKKVALECMLSSFSLDPTQERLTLIKKLFLQISKEKALKAAGCSGENQLYWDSNRLYNCAHPNSVKRKAVVMCDQAIQVGEDLIEDHFNNSTVEDAVPHMTAVVSDVEHKESLITDNDHKIVSTPQADSSSHKKSSEILNETSSKIVENDCDLLQNNKAIVEVKAQKIIAENISVSDKETVLSTDLQNGDLTEINTNSNKINLDDTRNRKLRRNRAGSNDLNIETTNLMNKPITRNLSSKLKIDANNVNLSQEHSKNKLVCNNETEMEDKIQQKPVAASVDHAPDFSLHNSQDAKEQNHDSACEISDSNGHESINRSEENPFKNQSQNSRSDSPNLSKVKAKELPDCKNNLSENLKITNANVLCPMANVTMSTAAKELNKDLNAHDKSNILIDSVNTPQLSPCDVPNLKVNEPCQLNNAQKRKPPVHQFNHVILDCNIPGISCQVLLDFVNVLESLRNRQLKTSNKWSEMKHVCEQYLETVSNLRYSFLTMQLNESVDSEADSMSEMTSWGNKNAFASHESDESMLEDHNVDKSHVLNRFFDTNDLTEANAFVNLSDIHVPQIPFEKLFCTDSSSHGGHKKRHKKHRNHDKNPEKTALRKLRRVDRDLVKKKKRKRRKNKKEKTHAKKHHFSRGKISKDYLKNKKRKRKLKKKKEANSGFISGDYCSDFSSEELMRLVKEHSNSYSAMPATSSKHPHGNAVVPYASPSGATSDVSDEPAKKKRKQVSFDKNNKETKRHEKHKHEKSKSSKKSKQLVEKCSAKVKNVTKENCLDQNTLNDYSRIVQFSSVKKMEAVQIRQRSVSLNLSDISTAEAQTKSPLLPDSQALLQPDLSNYSPEDIMKMRLLISSQTPEVVSASNAFDKDLISPGNQSVLKYVCSKMTSRLLSVAQGSKCRVKPESTMSTSVGLIPTQSSQLQSTSNIISLPSNLPQNVKHVIIESNSVPYNLISNNSVTSTTFVPVSSFSSFSSPSATETSCKSLMGTVMSSPQVTAFTIPIMQNVQDSSGSKLVTGKIVIPINQCGPVRSASSTPIPMIENDTNQSLPGMIVVKNGSNTQIISSHPRQNKTVSRLRGAPKIPISNIQNRARVSKSLPKFSKTVAAKAIHSPATKVSTSKPLLLTDQSSTSASQPFVSDDQPSVLVDQTSVLVDQPPALAEQLSESDKTHIDEASVLTDYLSKSDKTKIIDKSSNNKVPSLTSLIKCSQEEVIDSPTSKNSIVEDVNSVTNLSPSANNTSALPKVGESNCKGGTESVNEKETAIETSDIEDKRLSTIKDAITKSPSRVLQLSQTEDTAVTPLIEDGCISEDSLKDAIRTESKDKKEHHDKISDNIDNSRTGSSVSKTDVEYEKLISVAELRERKESVLDIDISSPSPQNKASAVEFDVDSLASQSPVTSSSSSLSITTLSSDSPVSIVMTTADQTKQLQPIIVASGVRVPGKTQGKIEGISLISEAPTRSFTSISDAVRFSLMDMDDATGSVENQVLQAFQVSHESSRDSLNFENQVISRVCETSTTTLSTTVLTTPQSSIREISTSPISQNFDNVVHGNKEMSECQSTLSRTTWILDDSTGNETSTSRLLQKSSDIDSASESKDDDRPKKKRKKKERLDRDAEAAHKFWCEICHRGFFSAYNLRRHCRNVHKMDLPKGTTDLPFSNPTSQCQPHVPTDHATESTSHSIAFPTVPQTGVGQKVSDYVLHSPTQEVKSQEFSMTSPSSQHSTPIKTTPSEFQLPSPSRMPSHAAATHVPSVTPAKDFRLQTSTSVTPIQISPEKLPETTKSSTKFPRLPTPCASAQMQTVPKIAQMHQVTLCAQPAVQQTRQLMQASGLVPPLSSVACQAQQIQQATQCPHFQANKPAAQPRIGQIQIMQHVGQIPQIHHVPHTHVTPKANPAQTFKKCVSSQHASKISESEQLQQQAAQLAQNQQLMANQREQMQKLVQLRQSAIAASGLVSQTAVSEAAALKSQFFQSQLAASRQAAASNQLQAGQRVQGAAYGLQAHAAAGQFFSPSLQQGQANCPHAVFSAQNVAEFSSASQAYPTIRLSSETNDGLEDLEQFLLENMPWSEQSASHHLAHQSSNRPSSADSLTLTVPSQTTGMGIHRTASNSKNKTTISRPKPRKPALPQCSKNLLGNLGRGVKKKPVPKKITKPLGFGCDTPNLDRLNQTPAGMQQSSLSMNSSIPSVQLMNCSEDKQTGCNLMLSKLPSKSPPAYVVNETDSYSSDSVQCIKVTHKPQASTIPSAGVNFNIFSQEPKITDKYLTHCDPEKLANASCSVNSSANTQTMVSFLDPCNLGNKSCTSLETRKNCFEGDKTQASADIGTSIGCGANIVPIPVSSSCALKNPAVFLGMQNGESLSTPKSDSYLFNVKERNLLACEKNKIISEHPFLASKLSLNADGRLKSQADLFLGGSKGDTFPVENSEVDESAQTSSLVNGEASSTELSKVSVENDNGVTSVSEVFSSQNSNENPLRKLPVRLIETDSTLKPNLVEVNKTIDKFGYSNNTQEETVNTISDDSVLTKRDANDVMTTNASSVGSEKNSFMNASNSDNANCIEAVPNSVKSNSDASEECSENNNNETTISDLTISSENNKNVQFSGHAIDSSIDAVKKDEADVSLNFRDDKSNPCTDNVDAASSDCADKNSSHLSVVLNDENKFPVESKIECHDDDQNASLRIALRIRKTVDGVNRINVDQDKNFKYSISQTSVDSNHLPVKKSNNKKKKTKQKSEVDLEENSILNNILTNKLSSKPEANFSCENKQVKDKKHKITPCDKLTPEICLTSPCFVDLKKLDAVEVEERKRKNDVSSGTEKISVVKSDEVLKGRSRLRDTPKTSVKRMCPCCVDSHVQKKCNSGRQNKHKQITLKARNGNSQNAKVNTRSSQRLRSRNNATS